MTELNVTTSTKPEQSDEKPSAHRLFQALLDAQDTGTKYILEANARKPAWFWHTPAGDWEETTFPKIWSRLAHEHRNDKAGEKPSHWERLAEGQYRGRFAFDVHRSWAPTATGARAEFDGKTLHICTAPAVEVEAVSRDVVDMLDRYFAALYPDPDTHERVVLWLACANDPATHIPALVDVGPGQLGKSSRSRALASIWADAPVPAETLFGVGDGARFNEQLVRQPLVYADEQLPAARHHVDVNTLKRVLTDDVRQIEGKGQPTYSLHGYVRLVVAINGPEHLRLPPFLRDDERTIEALHRRLLVVEPAKLDMSRHPGVMEALRLYTPGYCAHLRELHFDEITRRRSNPDAFPLMGLGNAREFLRAAAQDAAGQGKTADAILRLAGPAAAPFGDPKQVYRELNKFHFTTEAVRSAHGRGRELTTQQIGRDIASLTGHEAEQATRGALRARWHCLTRAELEKLGGKHYELHNQITGETQSEEQPTAAQSKEQPTAAQRAPLSFSLKPTTN